MNAFAAPATGTPLVSFRQVRKHFAVDGRRLEAIQQFDLEIGEGEFIAIVGASGCGKSTLLRLLIGLDRDYDGEIRVDGRPIAGIGGERGIVFQEHRLFPWLTVQQNVALGLVSKPLAKPTRRRGSTNTSAWSACTASSVPTRTSCPAAWPSAWRSPVAWWPARACCCSTSRSAPSTH